MEDEMSWSGEEALAPIICLNWQHRPRAVQQEFSCLQRISVGFVRTVLKRVVVVIVVVFALVYVRKV